MTQKPHICVCVCTFKRPHVLLSLLQTMESQETEGLFDYSIVVVDNDRSESARQTVQSHARQSRIAMAYYVEPEQSIALARNKAVASSKGDYIGFIDDDERPGCRWLLSLYKAIILFQTAGVLGPVLPCYMAPPPRWVVRGGYFTRPSYYSGYFLDWPVTRTGNCLVRRDLFQEGREWFDPAYCSGGEDRDFFRRKIAEGHVFVWCNEAPILESIQPDRWNLNVMIKRALLRGKMTFIYERRDPRNLLSSAGVAAIYSLGLPLLWVLSPFLGYEFFVKNLIRNFDHIGKILALFNIDVLKVKYVA